MATGKTQKYKPHFCRMPTARISLQKRDREIFKHVYKHRFLNSDHIAALVPGGKQGIKRRLNKLFHEGYLDRPREQVRPFRKGNYPYVYGLGNKGAVVIFRKSAVHWKRNRWTDKNREVKQRYLDHTLLVSHFMVCLELACREKDYVNLIEPKKLLLPGQASLSSRPHTLGWNVDLRKKIKGKPRIFRTSIIPDKVFGFYYLNNRLKWKLAVCFLEADRGTMPVKRSNLYTSSFQKKLICYSESFRQDIYSQMFRSRTVKVLILTKFAGSANAKKRILHIMRTAKELNPTGKASRIFLFARAGQFSLSDPGRILQPIWLNCYSHKPVSLVD
jgi:hypothetical protein